MPGTDPAPDSSAEWRPVPPHVEAEAARHAGGTIAEIDGSLISDPDGYVPPEAIRGGWIVDPQGRATGEYRHNPRYGRPIPDDLTALRSDVWMGWLPPPDPATAIRGAIAHMLDEQQPGSVLEWLQIVAPPRFLTSGRPRPENPGQMILVRSAIAVAFSLGVLPPGGRRENLWGVFTWCAVGLDPPNGRSDRTWLDFRMPLDRAEQLMKERLYSGLS